MGDPRHQGGEGVAGTPGACSQVFCHPIRCISLAHIDRDMCHTRSLYHNHHHHQAFQCQGQSLLANLLLRTQWLAFFMAGHVGGSTQRRRDRWVRSWHRHEQQSIRCALATSLHHSVQRPSPCPAETLALEAKVNYLEAMVSKLSRDVVRLVSSHQSSTATVPSRLPGCGVPVGPVAHASSVGGSCPSVLLPSLTGPETHDEESVRFLLLRTLLERETEESAVRVVSSGPAPSDSHVSGVSLSSSSACLQGSDERNVPSSSDVSWPEARWLWYQSYPSEPPDLRWFGSTASPRPTSVFSRFDPGGFRPRLFCRLLYQGCCYRGATCTFAHSRDELHSDAGSSQVELALEVDADGTF